MMGARTIVVGRRFRGPDCWVVGPGTAGMFVGSWRWRRGGPFGGRDQAGDGGAAGAAARRCASSRAARSVHDDEGGARADELAGDRRSRCPQPPALDVARRASSALPGAARARGGPACVSGVFCVRASAGAWGWAAGVRGAARRRARRHAAAMRVGAWQPDAAFLDEGGRLRAEFVWSAMDCPGGWAIAGPANTGTLQVEILGRWTGVRS